MFLFYNINDFLDFADENEIVSSSDNNKESVASDSSKTVDEKDSSLSESKVENSNDSSSEAKDKNLSEDSKELSVDDCAPGFVLPHLIGEKIGMTQIYNDTGKCFPTTLLQIGPCYITQIKSDKNDGYNSVQLGYKDLKESKINKSLKGHFLKSGKLYFKYLKEFRLNFISDNFRLGDQVLVNQFKEGDIICITGNSKGKGFTGHMKRHGFGGGRRSHGKNSVMRKPGSVGAGSDPSRVFPGMKMAGRSGNNNITVKNLEVLKVDVTNNLLFIKGSIPGASKGIVYLSKV